MSVPQAAAVRAALACFQYLCALLPGAFRDRHGQPTLALMEHLLLDAYRAGGTMRVVSVTARSAADLLIRLPAEYFRIGAVGGDLLFAARSMRRSPVATVMAVVMLAIGIGANAALFSIVDWVLLRPLPFPAPEELVRVYSAGVSPVTSPAPLTPSELAEVGAWPVIRNVAAFSTTTRIAHATGVDPFHVVIARTTGDWFGMLGVRPLLGRFATRDESSQSAPVAVLSEAAWRTRFFSDARVVGQVVEIDKQPLTIIGVVKTGNELPPGAELWRPMTAAERADDDRELVAMGRVIGSRDVDHGEHGDRTVGAPGSASRRRIWIENLQETQVRGFRGSLVLLWASAIVALAMVCASVAALIGARAADRAMEFTVRAAIGADRARLLQQLVTESLVLSALGGTGGLCLGRWTLDALVAMAPIALPRAAEIVLDWRVMLAGIVATVLSGVAVGVSTAVHVFRGGSRDALRGVQTTSTVRAGAKRTVVTLQMATAVVMTVMAVALGRTLRDRVSVDNGFDADRLVSVELSLRGMQVDEAAIYRTLIAAAHDVPGVEAAAVALREPTQLASLRTAVRVEGGAVATPVVLRPVTAAYFDVAGIPVTKGRRFDATDTRSAPRVAIVNASFARIVQPNADPIGSRIASDLFDAPVRVVGVVADVTPAGEPDRAAMYVSFDQVSTGSGSLLVRTIRDPRSVMPTLAPRLRQVAPALAFDRMHRVAEPLEARRSVVRFSAQLVSGFAAIVLLLALLSIYGLTDGQIASRSRELAIRIALGSTRGHALWTIVWPGIGSLSTGAAAGLALAVAGHRIIGARVDGFDRAGPLTLIAVALALVTAGGATALIAALRASRREPARELRGA